MRSGLATGCRNGSKGGGDRDPEGESKSRLARRCRANTGMCERPGQTENVCSPALFEPECRAPEQMRMANAFCRYLELAAEL
jgi:hypothetical protein